MFMKTWSTARGSVLRRLVVATAMLLTAGESIAHHSYAMFDPERIIKVSGVVQEFVWSNPHSSFKLAVAGADGSQEIWAIEMNSPNNLVREGWKRTSIQSGDKVTVTIRPLRDGTPGGEYVGIQLANGAVLGAVNPPPGHAQ